MRRTLTQDLTVAAGTENVQPFLVGLEGRDRKLISVWFEQVAGVDLRGYLDQDRIIDVGGETNQADVTPVPVDCPLPPGKEFKLGFYNTTGAPITAKVTLDFEEVNPS